MYEIERLVQDLSFTDCLLEQDAELEGYINDGWEIVSIATVSDATDRVDGIWRQYITQVIMLRRALFDHLEDTEEADIPAPMFTDLGRLAILNAARRNGDDLSGYVSMSSVGGAE